MTGEARERAERIRHACHSRAAKNDLDALLAELDAAERREDWLAKQLDGCIDSAKSLADGLGLALARALLGDLRDARAALADTLNTEKEVAA